MRGRKPQNSNVVPLTEDVRRLDFEASAKAKAKSLKPRGLDRDVSKVWDRLAPCVCHPTVNRLAPHMVEAFVMLCRCIARHERLRTVMEGEGETYETQTRNGTQLKSRPEVGQMNESFRQALTLLRDFGLTPAAERGIRATSDQGDFDFNDGDFA